MGLQLTSSILDPGGISNENDEWYTPPWIFEAIGVTFDMDPCSPGAPPSHVPALQHITKAENGLSVDWSSVKIKAPIMKWAAKCVQMRREHPSLRAIARANGVSDRALRNALRKAGP